MARKPKKKRKPSTLTKVTPCTRARFLAVIRITGNVSYACAQIKVSRKRMYELRANDEKLAHAWDDAHVAGIEALEQEARRRAFSGVKRVDVTYDNNGKVKHRKVVTEYSDGLLMFLLKAHKPNKYREVIRVENVDVSQLTIEQLEALASGEVPSGVRATAPASADGYVN